MQLRQLTQVGGSQPWLRATFYYEKKEDNSMTTGEIIKQARVAKNMSQEEYRKAAIDAVRQLSIDVGIPQSLKDIVKKAPQSSLLPKEAPISCP